MENKTLIVILIAIIIILAAGVGILYTQSISAKEPTKIKITSDKEQYEGGEISIQLTDLNKTPLSKEEVNITITNSKGKVVFDDVVKTNSKGKAISDLDLKKGKYNVNVAYGGNENYTGNNTTQKLTIKEEVVEETSNNQQVSSQESSSSSAESNDGYWETSPDAPFEYHTEYDSNGGFRQYDHAGNLVGSSYDEDQDDIADYVPRRI